MIRAVLISSVVTLSLWSQTTCFGQQEADPNFDTRVARPAYRDRHPKVAFDEAHSNFHTTGGRYKPFVDLISNDGYRVSPIKEKFTREALRGADVLVIANALGGQGMGSPEASTPAFTESECDAVHEWVQSGGSLLLITDHYPMGSAAEVLSKRFDVDMSKGVTLDPKNCAKDIGGPSTLVFSRENHLLADHPITRGRDESERVNKVITFTGQSLKGPEGSFAFLKLGDTAVDRGIPDEKETSAGGRAQGVALRLGKGRAVVLGEAAQLSAQMVGPNRRMGMNVPGIDNRQMALNIMHWLSGLLDERNP
jgi:hypothetical protein